jgi:polyhydroxyalkanoate synthesis regulator phasin
MTPDTILQSIQKGFRTTLGAATFVVDLVQYPERRDENINRLQTDFNRLAEEWEVKGETTEQEARRFVESLLNQRGSESSAPTAATATNVPPDVQADLQDLTAQIAAIRAELEKLRESGS